MRTKFLGLEEPGPELRADIGEWVIEGGSQDELGGGCK